MRILMVEDDVRFGPLVADNLSRSDFVVDLANTLEDAEAYLDTTTYALLLLDLHLPDGEGLNLLRRKGRASLPPTIMLTGASALADRVRGLDAGADDYIAKPFAHDELMARIRAVLRRPGNSRTALLSVGDIEFETVARTVAVDSRTIILPRRELVILESLMRSAGRVVMREALEEAVYAYGEEPLSNATEANISRLRKHLKEVGSRTEIQVVRGLGYRLAAGTDS